MRSADAIGVEVTYKDSKPQLVSVTGRYADGEYRRTADYTFRMDGSTAVLKTIDADGPYSVQAAESARDAVRETVADLPFVQGVSMFPEASE